MAINSSSQFVIKEIDGFSFSFEKQYKGKIALFSERLDFGFVKQDGISYRLTATGMYDEDTNSSRVYYKASIEDYDRTIRHLILPYSIKHKGHEFHVRTISPWNLFAGSNFDELTIACWLGEYMSKGQRNIGECFANVRRINVLPTVSPAVLCGTKLLYGEKQLSQSEKVFVPDDYMVCPLPESSEPETHRRYNTETDVSKSVGFWFSKGSHIKVLSIPNTFFVSIDDFCSYTYTTITQYKRTKTYFGYDEEEVSKEHKKVCIPCPIKHIIFRETIDNPDLYNIKFRISDNEYGFSRDNYSQVFRDTTLYVSKINLRRLDDIIGSSVFKAIKPLEEVPDEYKSLLGEQTNISKASKWMLTPNTTIAELRKQFTNACGASLKIYNGNKVAEPTDTLSRLGLTETKGIPFSSSTTVVKFIEQMKNLCGLKVKVYTSDEWVTALDDLTLEVVGKVKKNATKADMEKLL